MRHFAPAGPKQQPHRIVVLRGLGLRHHPLALGLLNAQSYRIKNAR
jgi:hypothetical protein